MKTTDNGLRMSGGVRAGRVNFPSGLKQAPMTIKTVHKAPIRGQKKSIGDYHMRRGK